MIQNEKQPRKTRIDKGRARKPAPTEREAWLNFFRGLTHDEQGFELGYLTAMHEASAVTVIGPVADRQIEVPMLPGVKEN